MTVRFSNSVSKDCGNRWPGALRALRQVSFACVMSGVLLTGCAAPNSYAGISFLPGAAAPELQDLARRAMASEKQAQLELGIAYELGLAVTRNLSRAKRLYTLAASDTGGIIWVYQPPIKKGRGGHVIPVNTGPKHRGLSDARDRLSRLKEAAGR